jgi:hypothetical protein
MPDALTPDPANPNRMDADDKVRMAKSLAAFGDLSGIILNRRTGLLIGGHQRADVLASATMDVTDLPAKEPDGTVARGWLVLNGVRYAVRVVDWPEETAHAALLAANRFGRVGHDDAALLKDLLESLDTGGLDADLTGYSEAAIEALMNQVHQDEPAQDADQAGKDGVNDVRSHVFFPPRVWLTQRAEIVAAMETLLTQYGGRAEWS